MPLGASPKRERDEELKHEFKLDDLSATEVRQIKRYEKKHKDRKTLLEELDRRL